MQQPPTCEEPSAFESRHREAKEPLREVAHQSANGAGRVGLGNHQLVLPEANDRHQAGSGGECNLDKAFALVEDLQVKPPGTS